MSEDKKTTGDSGCGCSWLTYMVILIPFIIRGSIAPWSSYFIGVGLILIYVIVGGWFLKGTCKRWTWDDMGSLFLAMLLIWSVVYGIFLLIL